MADLRNGGPSAIPVGHRWVKLANWRDFRLHSGASPRGGLGWTCPPHFCQRPFLRLMQIWRVFFGGWRVTKVHVQQQPGCKCFLFAVLPHSLACWSGSCGSCLAQLQSYSSLVTHYCFTDEYHLRLFGQLSPKQILLLQQYVMHSCKHTGFKMLW